MAYVQSVFPGFIPEGFLDQDNIDFIQKKITSVLDLEFKQHVLVDRASIIRIMQRVLEARLETIPKMNQRVIMTITNEFRNHQQEAWRNLKWEAHYIESQRLYDPTVERGPDLYDIKLANRLGKPRVGGTHRFYFT